MEMTALADEIEAGLRRIGRPGRAEGDRRYLKSDLEHVGVSVPEIRKVTVALLREHPQMSHDALVALAEDLWSRPIHECRMAAVELLVLGNAALSVTDVPLLERLLRESQTWALVDPLAIQVVGVLAERQSSEFDPVIRAWARSDDMWLRRASLLAHLPGLKRGGGDFDRFGALADAMLEDQRFFIRKAIGWVLRETGKARPERVGAWLLPRAARASGVTAREAVKYLPADDRQRIETARSPRRE